MNLNELLSALVWIHFGRLAFNSITIVDRENRKANFLKQEVKDHANIVTLTVVELIIKESTSISVKFTLELQSLKSLHTAYWI